MGIALSQRDGAAGISAEWSCWRRSGDMCLQGDSRRNCRGQLLTHWNGPAGRLDGRHATGVSESVERLLRVRQLGYVAAFTFLQVGCALARGAEGDLAETRARLTARRAAPADRFGVA
jgi:hypothetical protein